LTLLVPCLALRVPPAGYPPRTWLAQVPCTALLAMILLAGIYVVNRDG